MILDLPGQRLGINKHLAIIGYDFRLAIIGEFTLDTNFPEIWPFIIGFSFSVWTTLVGSLTDGVLADAILIPPHPLIKRR